jgi:hypothetical protein
LVCDLLFRGFELAECGRRYKPDQQPKDREHDEELEQGEAALVQIPRDFDRVTTRRSGSQVRPPRERLSNQTGSEAHRVTHL